MTNSVRFVQVDAFADRPFTGNPAAVMPLDSWLPDETLVAIAAENNLAETAFLVPLGTGEADYELRWFTPTLEVAMCGHATLASGHVLLGDDPAREKVRFATRKAGVLEVRRGTDGGYALDLPSWPTELRDLPEIRIFMGGDYKETRWRDGGYAVLVYEDEAAVRALTPDLRALARLGNILVIATAPGSETDVVSRAFAPGGGIDEDPVTGAAHAVIASYWAERLGRPAFTAYQASARGGRLECRLEGDRVTLGGQCITVIEGRFAL